jgi:Tol biopolymer transport system component
VRLNPFQNPAISSLTSTGDVALVRISPDGRYLAYVSTKRGQSSLWVRQIATESAVQIVPPETHRFIADAEFTPEGSYLDYTAYASFATEGKVYQIPVLGGTPRRLLNDGNTGVSFSPDGHQMAYATFNPLSSEGVLMLANADGGGARKLAARKASRIFNAGAYSMVRWSPDGQRIAGLVSNADPNGQADGLVEFDVSTSKEIGAPVRISDRISIGGGPIISLDGRHALFASFDKNGTIVGVMVSAVTGAQEGAEIKLADTLYDSAHGVRWTPDGGRSLAAVDIRSGTPNLWSGIFGDGPAKQLTHFTSGVVWDFGWSSDGK